MPGAIRCLSLLLLLVAAGTYGGTTGKVAGTVTDPSGSPLPGVAVQVPGLRLGGVTDADGRYFILQVPPGQHELRADMVGYRTTIATDVAVNADRTTTVDFTLQEEAIEVAPVIVTAGRPAIEKDVTGSQTIVDASKVAEVPVTRMLDFLSLETGVSVARTNELEIRGGGPSEIRFQVDGIDRTDALTSKAYAQLNQVLVSEVTLLTGGFNAEYGNVRSGMVNVVTKDGTERGFGLPWAAAVYSMSPAHKKHFGPGAYDSTQYDYQLVSLSNASNAYAPVYWPSFYEETRNDTIPSWRIRSTGQVVHAATAPSVSPGDSAIQVYGTGGFRSFWQKTPTSYKRFEGWKQKAADANFLHRGKGAYNYRDWQPEEVLEAWKWEANQDERMWQYGHQADWSLDLATGVALPRRWGGLVVGYAHTKEMTPVPALIPYYEDRSLETKLTLTPVDQLKLQLSYMTGRSESTGGGSKGPGAYSPEVQETGVTNSQGGDPVSLRDFGTLVGSISNAGDGGNDKLNLSYNGPLHGDFTQVGASVTYTFSPSTYFSASMGHTESSWRVERDLPRVDLTNWVDDYTPASRFGAKGWMGLAYSWSDTSGDKRGDSPSSLKDALTPGRAIYRNVFAIPNAFAQVPGVAKYVVKELYIEQTSGKTDTIRVVSPQGWVQGDYRDLTGTYKLAGGGDLTMSGGATQWTMRGDLTHAMGSHTFKGGVEYILAELEYETAQPSVTLGSPSNTEFRSYGGKWPAVQPAILGIYVQDKFESEGMIANFGFRAERFNAGQNAYLYADPYNRSVFSAFMGEDFTEKAVIAAGWDTTTMGLLRNRATGNWYVSYETIVDSLGDKAPGPWDVARFMPQTAPNTYWRYAPRFGIAHPVSDRTKLFFNYGTFYSAQKAATMYGFVTHDQQIGYRGRFQNLYNPNLRPARSTNYEVGIEHVAGFGFMLKVTGYAKHSVDQLSQLNVSPGVGAGGEYVTYRNANWEDVKGLEIKITYNPGRFVSGWFTYERATSRSGQIGVPTIYESPGTQATLVYQPFRRQTAPNAYLQGNLRLYTPADWGNLAGNWSVSVIQSWQSGGETVYNPSQVELRVLPEENFLPIVDSYNTSARIDKVFRLRGGRQVSAYLDIANALNTKRLNGSFENGLDYQQYIYERRLAGDDVKYGDPSTFYVLTRPYREKGGNWKAPISPRTDWLQNMYPREYRLGVRVNL